MIEYKKAKNKETEEIFHVIVGTPSKYFDGEEYISVTKDPTLPQLKPLYMKRKALIFNWKGMQ